MELTKNQIKITKGIAILFMLLLHLFCTKAYEGLYTPILFIGNTPLVYYIALFGDCCVVIYCFCSGYGLLISYKNNEQKYFKNNIIRILNLYINYWIILFLFVNLLGTIMGQGDNHSVIGVIFGQNKIYSKLYNIINHKKYKNIIGLLIIILIIVAHGFVETLFVAVFTGIVFICVFNLMDKPKWINKLLSFLGNHSTKYVAYTYVFLYHLFQIISI